MANLSSLSVNWRTKVDGAVFAEPVSFNGSVFVVTENDTIYSLSTATGAVQWYRHVATPANSIAAPYAL
jgi:outer membrane protein assembly factor BamB